MLLIKVTVNVVLLQTLFNPNKTVVKMFVVVYDLSEMPPHCQTFIRQRTLYMPVRGGPSDIEGEPVYLRYLIHLRSLPLISYNGITKFTKILQANCIENLRNTISKEALTTVVEEALCFIKLFQYDCRFSSSKSGNVYLHTDMRVIFARDKLEFDARVANYELRSFTEGPTNPQFSPKR